MYWNLLMIHFFLKSSQIRAQMVLLLFSYAFYLNIHFQTPQSTLSDEQLRLRCKGHWYVQSHNNQVFSVFVVFLHQKHSKKLMRGIKSFVNFTSNYHFKDYIVGSITIWVTKKKKILQRDYQGLLRHAKFQLFLCHVFYRCLKQFHLGNTLFCLTHKWNFLMKVLQA